MGKLSKCWRCDAVAPCSICRRCHVARYCSSECGQEHWASHRSICRELQVQHEAQQEAHQAELQQENEARQTERDGARERRREQRQLRDEALEFLSEPLRAARALEECAEMQGEVDDLLAEVRSQESEMGHAQERCDRYSSELVELHCHDAESITSSEVLDRRELFIREESRSALDLLSRQRTELAVNAALVAVHIREEEAERRHSEALVAKELLEAQAYHQERIMLEHTEQLQRALRHEMDLRENESRHRECLDVHELTSIAEIEDRQVCVREAANEAMERLTTQRTALAVSSALRAAQGQVQQEDADRARCKICMNSGVGCAFIPCGHHALCMPCAQQLLGSPQAICPICRTPIQSVLQTFS